MALCTCLLPSKGLQQGGEAVWRLRIEEIEGIRITNKQIAFICARKKHALLSGLLAEILQGFPGLEQSPQSRECRRKLLCPWPEEVFAGGPGLWWGCTARRGSNIVRTPPTPVGHQVYPCLACLQPAQVASPCFLLFYLFMVLFLLDVFVQA